MEILKDARDCSSPLTPKGVGCWHGREVVVVRAALLLVLWPWSCATFLSPFRLPFISASAIRVEH